MERLIGRRRECPELGRVAVLDVDHAAVLAHRCDWEATQSSPSVPSPTR